MDLESFTASLEDDSPPPGASSALAALWHERRGDWHEAHRRAQSQDDAEGAWVHAYLHRVEGTTATPPTGTGAPDAPCARRRSRTSGFEIATALL